MARGDIPKEFKKNTIFHALWRSNMIEYTDVPDYYLNQVKKIMLLVTY